MRPRPHDLLEKENKNDEQMINNLKKEKRGKGKESK